MARIPHPPPRYTDKVRWWCGACVKRAADGTYNDPPAHCICLAEEKKRLRDLFAQLAPNLPRQPEAAIHHEVARMFAKLAH